MQRHVRWCCQCSSVALRALLFMCCIAVPLWTDSCLSGARLENTGCWSGAFCHSTSTAERDLVKLNQSSGVSFHLSLSVTEKWDKSAAGQEVIFTLRARETQMDQEVSLHVLSPRSKSGSFRTLVAFRCVGCHPVSVSWSRHRKVSCFHLQG